MAVRPTLHRDQIHGDTLFDPLSVALLNTPEMQRLGRVYQLGYSHLVYRGGNHTRLSHVMGAAHMADTIVDRLAANYEQSTVRPDTSEAAEKDTIIEPEDFLPLEGQPLPTRWLFLRHVTRWAALLHDIAHIPLGHTLEDEFSNVYEKHDSFTSPRVAALWHTYEQRDTSPIKTILQDQRLYPKALQNLPDIATTVWQVVMIIALYKEHPGDDKKQPRTFDDLLNEKQGPFVTTLRDAYHARNGNDFRPYMADIVGNTICADYLDYMKRDPWNVGLDVLFDDRVVSRFYVARNAAGDYRMALALIDHHGKKRLDTCTGVVELFRQRYRFAEIIYYHKTKIAASALFYRALQLFGKTRLPEVRPTTRKQLRSEELRALADRLTGTTAATALAEVADACLPASLIDDELGDEALHLHLQHEAIRELDKLAHTIDAVTKNPHRQRVLELLRCLRLVRAIQQRHLHKVGIAIGPKEYLKLAGKDEELQHEETEKYLATKVEWLRDAQHTTDLTTKMLNAAGWEDNPDALIIYVPPRKTQAKGILTYCVGTAGVATIEQHEQIADDVNKLKRDYAALWRLIVLVAPERRHDAVALSAAMDALCAELFGDDVATNRRQVVQRCAWFKYLPKHVRAAAAEYAALLRTTDAETVDYKPLEEISVLRNELPATDLAHASAVLHYLARRVTPELLETILAQMQERPLLHDHSTPIEIKQQQLTDIAAALRAPATPTQLRIATAPVDPAHQRRLVLANDPTTKLDTALQTYESILRETENPALTMRTRQARIRRRLDEIERLLKIPANVAKKLVTERYTDAAAHLREIDKDLAALAQNGHRDAEADTGRRLSWATTLVTHQLVMPSKEYDRAARLPADMHAAVVFQITRTGNNEQLAAHQLWEGVLLAFEERTRPESH